MENKKTKFFLLTLDMVFPKSDIWTGEKLINTFDAIRLP